MSKLLRMNIFGIRSFGPDEDDLQKIKFNSPLTLIQGQNGCGKTTIIEALKFAITGDLPGGSANGQGFVYDPKLAKSFETKGQVKLRLNDVKSEPVTVTKSVSVIQKGDKLQFKRLDSTISRGNKDNHASGKCVDVDNAMCMSLGVSKSIINNVIFCHQEDSNWPLDEGKKLKEKFDDIFDSSKYNNCLNHMSKYLKLMNDKDKILVIEESALLARRQEIERRWMLYREKQGKLEGLNIEIKELEEKLKPVTDRIAEIYKIEINFSKLLSEVECKKNEFKSLTEQQEELLKVITEFKGSDEELNNQLSQFEQNRKSYENEIDCLINKKRSIEETERLLIRKTNEHKMKLGALQTEEKHNSIRVENRNKLIQKGVNDLKLSVDFVGNEQQIISTLVTELTNRQMNIKTLEKEMENEDKQLQNIIDKVREEFAKLKENIMSKKKSFEESKIELRKNKQILEDLNTAGDQLELTIKKLNRNEKEYKSLQSSVDSDGLKAKIESEKKNLKQMEEQLSTVDSEVQTLQQFTELRTEIDLKENNRVEKQKDLQKLKNKHLETFEQIFDDIPSSNLKYEIEQFVTNKNKLIRDVNFKINQKQREVMRLENVFGTNREKLNEKEKDLITSKRELAKHCDDTDLEEMIDEVQIKIEKLQNERGIFNTSKDVYQKYIKAFQSEKPCCPICKRDVQEKNHATTIVMDLNKTIQNLPHELLKVDNKLAEAKKKYHILLELKPVNEKIQKLKREVPELKNQIETMEINLDEAKKELDKLQKELGDLQKIEKLANSTVGDATLMDQIQKELTKINQDISLLNMRMPSHVSNRGLHEALSDQETLKMDIRTSRNNIESSHNQLAKHVERLQFLKEEQNKLTAEQLEIQKNLQGKDHLIVKKAELETKLTTLENEIEKLHEDAFLVENNLESSMKEKDDVKRKYKKDLELSQTLVNSLQKIMNKIQDYQSEIDQFIKKNVQSKINEINQEILDIKKDIEKYMDNKINIDKKVDSLKDQISRNKIHFRELEDNVKLREKKKKQTVLQKEIEEMSNQLDNENIRQINIEKKYMLKEESILRETINKKEGRKGELEVHMKEVKTDLELPENAQVALKHKKKYLEKILHEKGIQDLRKFIKAMDWALMQFHKQRMTQINSIIKEQWRMIYKGNDIEYIEIKTEDAKPSNSKSDKRKVYNYGIVQVKNGVEMDMRGRCSAGQRVLASLIIRIALAETFSTNCGIFALDEPTTNLDRENIISLSEALITLIDQKAQQRNFQLLVITHDEDFVERLRRVKGLESYYIVKRNCDGKSIIIEER